MHYTCDGCDAEMTGQRVVFTTETTDAHGVDVDVAKRWVHCPACADEVFARLGMRSPFEDGDVRTLTYPGDEAMASNVGGFTHVP